MNPARPHRSAVALLALILLIAAAVYFYTATRHSLIVDEAIHGRGGKAILSGDWHLGEDKAMKPPVIYYTLAAVRGVTGGSDVAGRVAAAVATLAGVVFLFGIGRRWFDDRVALIACAIYPFGILTLKQLHQAKTEPFLMLFLLAAMYFATSRRAAWCGFCYAMAFCTKQQAALSFPLVMLLLHAAAFLPDENGARETKAFRPLWRFSLGAAGPVAVLIVWSTFTQIPFAWLAKEITQSKYADAMAYSFGTKFAFWIVTAGGLFASPAIRWFALLAVPLSFALIVAGRAGGRYTFASRRDLTAAAVFSGFSVFYVLLHGMPKMTLYLRFMVPIAPWLSLVVAWAIVVLWDRSIEKIKNRPLRIALAVALAAGLTASTAVPLAAWVTDYAKPVYQDEIPEAAAWLIDNAPGSIVFEAKGPEFSYYLFGSSVDYRAYDKDLARLAKHVRRHYGRDAYLFFRESTWQSEKSNLRAVFEPIYRLDPVWQGSHGLSRMFRLTPDPRIGVDETEGTVTYPARGTLAAEPLTCGMLRGLLARGFSKWRRGGDAAPVVTLGRCELDGDRVAALDVRVTGARYEGVRVRQARFRFEDLKPDWPALLIVGRLAVQHAGTAAGEIVIGEDGLAEHIQRKNKNLSGIAVEVTGDEVAISAVAETPLGDFPVRIAGLPTLPGDGGVHLKISQATVNGWPPPRFAIDYAESLMNPSFASDLPELGLAGTSIEPARDGGALVLRFSKTGG